MPCPRRKLRFSQLAEVIAEAERLASQPYHRAGTWSLSQNCMHLAKAFELSMDGFEKPGPGPIRGLFMRIILHGVLWSGRIPAGRPLPQKHVPADLDAASSVAVLRAAITRFATYNGPLAAHPYFGRISHRKWTAFHLVHCAHHLSFLIPEKP